MIKNPLLLPAILILAYPLNLQAQDAMMGESAVEDWPAIQNRWIESQPMIIVFTDSGTQYTGQPIHAAYDTLYLLPGNKLPVGADWPDEMLRIPFNEIEEVLLQRGGNKLTRSNVADGLGFPQTDRFYSKPFQALRKASIYSDTLVLALALEEAFPHSQILRQVYPAKRIRISVGLGIGGNRFARDAEEALRQSPLPHPESSYENRAYIDPVDISVRFWNRFFLGGQYRVNNSTTSIYAYNYGQNADINYDCYIHFTEHRIYGEYAFIHVDRYFTKRYELLAGAGYLMGRPEWSCFYYYNDYTDPENWIYENAQYVQEDKLHGVQLRTAFHYYLFPAFSLWTGLEANLFKSWTVEALEFPSSDPEITIPMEEHTLNFSSVRFKFGVSIFL